MSAFVCIGLYKHEACCVLIFISLAPKCLTRLLIARAAGFVQGLGVRLRTAPSIPGYSIILRYWDEYIQCKRIITVDIPAPLRECYVLRMLRDWLALV